MCCDLARLHAAHVGRRAWQHFQALYRDGRDGTLSVVWVRFLSTVMLTITVINPVNFVTMLPGVWCFGDICSGSQCNVTDLLDSGSAAAAGTGALCNWRDSTTVVVAFGQGRRCSKFPRLKSNEQRSSKTLRPIGEPEIFVLCPALLTT